MYECRAGDHTDECGDDECLCVSRQNVGDGEFDFCMASDLCADCHFVCEGDDSGVDDFRCERDECQEDECWCYASDYKGAQCWDASECADIGESIDVLYECRAGDRPAECGDDECFCVNRQNVGDGEFDFCLEASECADCHFVCEDDDSDKAKVDNFRCERDECEEDECWCYAHDYKGAQCYPGR